eukprot:8611069-Pyramimonas_sp.AAC.2
MPFDYLPGHGQALWRFVRGHGGVPRRRRGAHGLGGGGELDGGGGGQVSNHKHAQVNHSLLLTNAYLL